MAKINRENFGYLGGDFQVRLIAQLLIDNKFAEAIIDIIDANYFEDQHLKVIMSTIKDAYQDYNIIPDIGSLEFRLNDTLTNEFEQKYALAELQNIKKANLNDGLEVQTKGMLFCKQQELKKSVKQIQAIIDKGDISRYHECEEIIKKAINHGDYKDNGENVCDNIEEVLAEDFRKPIPTGIEGLDEIMDGGLARGELGIILAGSGVGKSTMITKLANTAKNLGYNVLQIFFEDNPKVIKRKHISCWSGYDLNDLSLHKTELIELAKRKDSENGVLKLKKFPSDGTTIPIIRQYLRKQIASGFRPDIILLDYIDCIEPSKKVDDVNVGQGNVMRQFESLLDEFGIAGWTATQGNRNSLGAEIVEANQMGGSIKKMQIGHFLVSIAKTLDQKENGTATIAILKSRFGKDGIILSDIVFNNANLQINMGLNKGARTQSEYKQDKVENENKHVAFLLEGLKKRKEALNTPQQEPTE